VKTFSGGTGIDNFTIRGLGGNNDNVGFGGLFGIAPAAGTIMAPESIERVEVFKGANILLNGLSPAQGASLGFINLVPKRAGDEPLIAFTPDYTMNSQFGGHLDVGRRFGPDKAFGVRFNGVYREGDTPIDNQSQATQLAALGLDYRGDAVRLSADLGYQYQNTDAVRRPVGLANGVAVPAAPRNTLNWGQPWTFTQTKNYYGLVRGEWDVLPDLTAFVAVGGSINDLKQQSWNDTLQNAGGTITGTPNASTQYTHNTSTEAGLRANVDTGPVHHEAVLSVASVAQSFGRQVVTRSSLTSNLFSPTYVAPLNFGTLTDPEDLPESNHYENSGISFADTFSVLDKRIQLTLGAREQKVRSEGVGTQSYDAKALSPAAALLVKPWEYTSFYANYIDALETGGIAPSDAANAGQIFAPIKTTQYEVGAKVDTGRLGGGLALFTAERPTYDYAVGTNIYSETGKQRYRGIELTAFGEVAKGVRILSGITYLDATLVETTNGANIGNRTPGIPKYRATLGGEWDTPFVPGLTLTATGQWQSSTYFEQANLRQIDGWYEFDLGARYTIERPGAEPIVVRAAVRNVLDSNDWVTSQGRLGLSEPRTFLLSTTFKF
jgi:iron complex outermembrane receptor protein